jgi:hypothetical protein
MAAFSYDKHNYFLSSLRRFDIFIFENYERVMMRVIKFSASFDS